MMPTKQLKVALLATPDTTASTVYGMHDLFCSPGRDWELIVSGTPAAQKISPMVVAERSEAFQGANGVWIHPDCTFAECPDPDVICISDLLVSPEDEIASRNGAAIQWIKACYRKGATLASACSGAMLLAAAGLLDGDEATTHWAYCDALNKRHPQVRFSASRALVAAGDGQRIVTSGGGSTWYDMALFVIARFLGQEEAMRGGQALPARLAPCRPAAVLRPWPGACRPRMPSSALARNGLPNAMPNQIRLPG